MNQIGFLTIHEIKIYLRSKTFWLLGAFIMAAMFLPFFVFLLIQFMVISIVTRDESSGFSGILVSLPYRTVNLFLARVLSVFFLLLGLWPFMLLTVGFLPEMTPAEWLFNAGHLVFLTLKYIAVCMLAMGTVFLAGLITLNAWRLYLTIFFCWVVGDPLYHNLSVSSSWSELFTFGRGVIRLTAPSAAVGYFPQQNLLPWVAIFQVAIIVLLLALVMVFQKMKRREPIFRKKLLFSFFFIVTLLLAVAGFTACKELNQRERGFRAVAREMEKAEPVSTKAMEATALAEMESYQLAVKLRTQAHHLEGRATIKLKLAGREESIFFTLRNYFVVKAVTEAGGGDALEWRRNGSRLEVRVPERYRQGGRVTLVVVYSGQVQEWVPGPSAHPSGPVNFVAPQFSLLRSGYAWYPVPGVHPLYTRKHYATLWHHSPKTTLWAERVIHSPVLFTLTVDLDTGGTAVSNLERAGVKLLDGEYKKRYHFQSLQGREVFLLAGPYHYEKRIFPGRKGFIEIYSYYKHQKRIAKLLNALAMPYLFYEDLIQPDCPVHSGRPSGKVCTMVEMPPFSYLCGEGESSSWLTLTDTVLMGEELFETEKWRLSSIAQMQANKRELAVLQRWWNVDPTTDTNGWSREGNIAEGFVLYLYTLNMEKKYSREFYKQMKEKLVNGRAIDGEVFLPFLAKGPVVRDVFITLDTIRTELGVMGIKKIASRLYPVYIDQGSIHSKDFTKTVEEVAAGNLPPAKIHGIRKRLKNITRRDGNPETLRYAPLWISTFRPEDNLP